GAGATAASATAASATAAGDAVTEPSAHGDSFQIATSPSCQPTILLPVPSSRTGRLVTIRPSAVSSSPYLRSFTKPQRRSRCWMAGMPSTVRAPHRPVHAELQSVQVPRWTLRKSRPRRLFPRVVRPEDFPGKPRDLRVPNLHACEALCPQATRAE